MSAGDTDGPEDGGAGGSIEAGGDGGGADGPRRRRRRRRRRGGETGAGPGRATASSPDASGAAPAIRDAPPRRARTETSRELAPEVDFGWDAELPAAPDAGQPRDREPGAPPREGRREPVGEPRADHRVE